MIDGSDRPLAPLGRRSVPVVDVSDVGPYTLIEIDDHGGVVPRAGQFYMLATATGWSGGEDGRPYLPRAVSFARAVPAASGVILTFLLESVGPGTGKLCAAMPGDELLIAGPFGNGFAVQPGEAVLIGGGIGVAPLLALLDDLLAQRRKDVSVLLGFRDASYAAGAELFDGAATVATDDGSEGHHGLVTDLLPPHIDHPGATIYSCGPPPMLEAVRSICVAAAAPAQLALESGMACGYGSCYGCVVLAKDGYVRLCVDGPVLDAADLEVVPAGGH